MSAERVAVLGVPGAATALAAALALRARSSAGVPAAVVVLWSVPGGGERTHPAGSPSFGAARRLAARLASRDLYAFARGRLAWVVLPGDGADGIRALRRIEAAAGDVPVVLALTRPRDGAIDLVLAECEEIVAATAPGSAVARAALEDLARLGVPCRACAPPAGMVGRLAALAGLRAAPAADAHQAGARGTARPARTAGEGA